MNNDLNIFAALARKNTARQQDIDKLNGLTAQPPATQQGADLSAMKTPDLITRWQRNNGTAERDELLKRMQPTIKSAMNSYAQGMGDRLSVKAAKLTLDSLRLYDASKGADPRTFVFHNLHRLSRYAADSAAIMKEPEGLSRDRRYVQDYIDKFQDRKGREPSLAELADATGLSRKRLDSILNGSNTVVSESATLSEDSNKDTVARNTLGDDDYFEYVYSSVGPIDQKIMEWSSGLHGKPVLSTGEIARRLRVSDAAVSQRKGRIQRQMSDVRGLL